VLCVNVVRYSSTLGKFRRMSLILQRTFVVKSIHDLINTENLLSEIECVVPHVLTAMKLEFAIDSVPW
jgi:hypothetical protein